MIATLFMSGTLFVSLATTHRQNVLLFNYHLFESFIRLVTFSN